MHLCLVDCDHRAFACLSRNIGKIFGTGTGCAGCRWVARPKNEHTHGYRDPRRQRRQMNAVSTAHFMCFALGPANWRLVTHAPRFCRDPVPVCASPRLQRPSRVPVVQHCVGLLGLVQRFHEKSTGHASVSGARIRLQHMHP